MQLWPNSEGLFFPFSFNPPLQGEWTNKDHSKITASEIDSFPMNSLKHEDGFVSWYFQTFVTLFNSWKLKQNQIKPFSVNSKDWKLQKNDTIFSHFLNWFFGFLILRTWKLVWLNINWFGVVHFMLKDWGDCWLLKISQRRFETSEWT